MSKELVEAFNALPRRAKAPSGRVPNEWHFDIRYIQMEPTPSHVIYFLQPQSQFTHMERMPIGLGSGQSGLEFFPETSKEAAPVLAKGILHAFLNNMGCNDRRLYPETQPYAPWKLSTDDKSLGAAVGHELKRMGVRPEALCNIGFSSRMITQLAQESFSRIFEGLKMACGLNGIVATAIRAPESIRFENFHVPPAQNISPLTEELDRDLDDEGRNLNKILKYYSVWTRGVPSDGTEYDSTKAGEKMYKEMDVIKARIEEKPERVVNAAADRGDADAALDYGIRLMVGLGCKANRKRAREYLIKAAYSPSASVLVQEMAHSILVQWYMETTDGKVRARYMFAAAHHCNIAAKLCTTLSSAKAPASPGVLWFMSRTFERVSEKHPELYYWYKDAVRALEARNEEIEEGRNKMLKKRLKNSIRYRCAAPNCHIEADTGSMLSRCSGPCDADKKPYYCSKECQKADWKNHKPFCRPGAECSIIDNGTKYDITATAPANKSEGGALQVPITFKDGKTIMLSSSTMDAKMLKELQDLSIKNNDV